MHHITRTVQISEREIKNKCITREIAIEGMVLLENNGILPLNQDVKRIALFGMGARKTVRGGTGSGEVNVRDYVTVEQGLIQAGYHIVTTQWLDSQEKIFREKEDIYDRRIRGYAEEKGPQRALIHMMKHPFVPPVPEPLTGDIVKKYLGEAAIYVLSRNSGEGADRKLIQGDYMLYQQEIDDILLLSKQYKHFVLMLNTGGIVDLSPILNTLSQKAVLLISQGGSSLGLAVADIISGRETPSGKLASTWAQQYQDYPGWDTFGTVSSQQDDICYKEGIYIGYRHFDKYNIAPLYPFGYGKSYTDFAISVQKGVTNNHREIVLQIQVKNIGSVYAGQEVVQIYGKAPEGNINKPVRQLCGFVKTTKLLPNKTEQLTMKIKLDDLASYDQTHKCFVLEPGEYILYVGNSSKNLKECFKYTVDKIIYLRNRTSIKTEDTINRKKKAQELVELLSPGELVTLCVGGARMQFTDFSVIGNAANTVAGAAGDTTGALWEKYGIPALTMADGPAGIRVNPKYYQRGDMLFKNPAEDPIFKKILPKEALKADLDDCMVGYQYCTALPIATMLAQSFNTKLLYKAGQLIAEEMEEMGIDLWLAPGMNIQRNPLGGRNFEYFSEDPFLTGVCGAAITLGVQKDGKHGACIKHFAANNQETNRNYSNSVIDEQTLHEIYLRGFEICVTQAFPASVMTALNLVNGIHASNHQELLKDILRNTWGFEGLVMTDWGACSDFGVDATGKKYGCSSAVKCIKAGNDLIMPGSQREEDELLEALENGDLSMEELRWCAANVLQVVLRKAGIL